MNGQQQHPGQWNPNGAQGPQAGPGAWSQHQSSPGQYGSTHPNPNMAGGYPPQGGPTGGQVFSGHVPPSYGHETYTAPQGATNANGAWTNPVGGEDPLVKDAEDNALLWLCVGGGGFWFGLGWITGPIAWYMAGKLRRDLRARGHEPSTMLTAAYVVGILTSIVSWLAILTVIAFFTLFFFGFFGAALLSA